MTRLPQLAQVPYPQEVPYWPGIRRPDNHRPPYWQKKIATAAREGDMPTVGLEAGGNCTKAG